MDTDLLAIILRESMHECPTVIPLLRKLAERLARTRTLSGHMKLGEKLHSNTLSALGVLLPNTAIDIRPTGEVYLRLDRAGIRPEEVDEWIGVLCDVTGVPSNTSNDHPQRLHAETATILDRCRLQYPDLYLVWESIQPDNLASAARTRGVEDLQRELFRLGDAVCFLLGNHPPLGLADLSARYFGDSKALKSSPSLTRRIEEWLLSLRELEITEESRRRIWADCGVVDNATAIKVTIFGPLVYRKHGQRFDWISQLYDTGETATLSWDNLQDVDAIELPSGTRIVTCENETPFGGLVRERAPGLLIYTAGYPNAAVCRLLELLPDDAVIYHWGDSDPDGLYIASRINRIHPVTLWRCGIDDLKKRQGKLIKLSADRAGRAKSFLAAHPDFEFAQELGYTLTHGWLEQEQWADGT